MRQKMIAAVLLTWVGVVHANEDGLVGFMIGMPLGGAVGGVYGAKIIGGPTGGLVGGTIGVFAGPRPDQLVGTPARRLFEPA